MRGLDAYTITARIAPALLTISPAALWLLTLAPPVPTHWTSLAGTAGAWVLLAVVVRRVGRWREPSLLRHNGGDQPTTTLLLTHATGSTPSRPTGGQTTRQRRRAALEAIYGHPLLTADEELRDPAAARERIADAVRVLRVRVGAQSETSPLVAAENRTYGFLRNSWAVKPLGLLLSVAVLAASVAWAASTGWTPSCVAVVAYAAAVLLAWTLAVRPAVVLATGYDYAERLLDALDHPMTLISPSP